ncbi:Casein kinase II subunit beta [Pleurostoma richardsiae]|uniref:Casein kinase II subunit beta n=1 Tax=Pleurostoma richardsiae TaxID=41990 RepID=A0AA38RIL7_9PEZI|nr:Casein kinase II subunit beta [Pleurostoma richardsiae]
MNQLDAQVSDLRSFLPHPPGPPTPSNAAHAAGFSPRHPGTHGASPRSAPGDNSAQPSTPSAHGLPAKRRSEDDGGSAKQQRSKRNRYISIACNECKRRKIKCNGETPCQRCGNLNLACLYAPNCCSGSFRDSDEFKRMADQMSRLQDQVDTLFRNMTALQQDTLRLAPIQDRTLALPSTTATPSPSSSIPSLHRPDLPPFRPPHSFRGPTSIAFTVDVAKNTLHNMGYSGADGPEENGVTQEDTPTTSPMIQQREPPPRQSPQDPLWDFDKDELVRLCRLHEDEVGIMYPVVNIDDVINYARTLGSWMEAAKNNGLVPPFGQDEGITDIKTLQLKIIMCCALAVEEHGNSAKAIRLWESIEPIADRMLMSDPSDVGNLPFLALVAGYRFLAYEEVLSWRVMGQVARLCLELGLHRRDGLAKIPGDQDRRNAVNTFWSAYVLERRWSFGTGLPFVIHDDKIDPKLPYPDEHPYLVAMITYSKLGAKIWKLVDYFEPALIRELKREDFESLDREIMNWYDSVPADVKISNLNNQIPLPSTPSYNLERLQIWTRLRLNQIRIWLFTPVLHSASSIAVNMHLAQRAVELAKETIHYLTKLNNTSNLYRRIQVFYHQFLTSAIAVLFLASTHAPLQFSANCRDEFYMALELVKDMSAKSWVSQRLWRTVRGLKNYAPRLGLRRDDPGARESNAAQAMAGLAAGQHTNGVPTSAAAGSPGVISQAATLRYPSPAARLGSVGPPRMPSSASTPAPQGQSLTDDQNNGLLLQSEMTKIFEGYMGMSGIPHPFARGGLHSVRTPDGGAYGTNGGVMSPREMSEGSGPGYSSDGVGVYQQLKEMF